MTYLEFKNKWIGKRVDFEQTLLWVGLVVTVYQLFGRG